MNCGAIVDEIVVSHQLRSGQSPIEILAAHYDELSRHAKSASESAPYREARQAILAARPDFFQELAAKTGKSLAAIIGLFKDSRVVMLFRSVGWTLSGLWDVLREGHRAYHQLHHTVASYVAKTRVSKWTESELRLLDEYLQRHPTTRRIAGFAVGALLVYIWFTMSHTGDVEYDFDLSEVLAALSGSYTLADLFAGPEGTRLLLAFAVGVATGLSFPWPGPMTVHFAIAIVNTLAKKLRKVLS
jgi:hypothetical protein